MIMNSVPEIFVLNIHMNTFCCLPRLKQTRLYSLYWTTSFSVPITTFLYPVYSQRPKCIIGQTTVPSQWMATYGSIVAFPLEIRLYYITHQDDARHFCRPVCILPMHCFCVIFMINKYINLLSLHTAYLHFIRMLFRSIISTILK